MSVRYLIDTDRVVDYLNDVPAITDRVRDLIRRRILPLSVISLAELHRPSLSPAAPHAPAGDRTGMSRLALERLLGERHIPLRYTAADLDADLQTLSAE